MNAILYRILTLTTLIVSALGTLYFHNFLIGAVGLAVAWSMYRYAKDKGFLIEVPYPRISLLVLGLNLGLILYLEDIGLITVSYIKLIAGISWVWCMSIIRWDIGK